MIMKNPRLAGCTSLDPELPTTSDVPRAMVSALPKPPSASTRHDDPADRPGWITISVILLLTMLACLAPLLHAHAVHGTVPSHPAGIHLPDQTVAPEFLGGDEPPSAPAIAPDTRSLATIVLAESHRRDGSPTPSRTDASDVGPPQGGPREIDGTSDGETVVFSHPGADPRPPDWPPSAARPPPPPV